MEEIYDDPGQDYWYSSNHYLDIHRISNHYDSLNSDQDPEVKPTDRTSSARQNPNVPTILDYPNSYQVPEKNVSSPNKSKKSAPLYKRFINGRKKLAIFVSVTVLITLVVAVAIVVAILASASSPNYRDDHANQTHLNLSFMNLTQINASIFANLTRLQYLNMSHNLLTYLDTFLLRNATNLLALDLSYNHLTYINADMFTGLVHIELLALGHNPFRNLTPTFIFNFYNLSFLDLSACNLFDSNLLPLQPIYSSSANSFTHMTQFHLEDNRITNSSDIVLFFKLSFSSMHNTNLLIIYLQGNPIYNSMANLTTLCGFNANCVIATIMTTSTLPMTTSTILSCDKTCM